MRNFLTRTLTGFFIVLIVLGGVLIHPLTFILVGLAIIIGSQIELSRMVFPVRSREYLIKGLLISVPTFLVSPYIASGILSESILLIPVILLILVLISELYTKGDNHFESISKVLLMVVYTTMPYVFMVFAAFSYDKGISGFSPELVAAFFVLLWVNDTGAYLLGVAFGRHKLLERISPKKTWEGFIGGVLLTLVAAWFAGKLLGSYSQADYLIAGLIVSVFGTFGDLFESQLKREAGIKDSGSFLPGHGGFLDRFDGLTFAFPALYIFITFFG